MFRHEPDLQSHKSSDRSERKGQQSEYQSAALDTVRAYLTDPSSYRAALDYMTSHVNPIEGMYKDLSIVGDLFDTLKHHHFGDGFQHSFEYRLDKDGKLVPDGLKASEIIGPFLTADTNPLFDKKIWTSPDETQSSYVARDGSYSRRDIVTPDGTLEERKYTFSQQAPWFSRITGDGTKTYPTIRVGDHDIADVKEVELKLGFKGYYATYTKGDGTKLRAHMKAGGTIVYDGQ